VICFFVVLSSLFFFFAGSSARAEGQKKELVRYEVKYEREYNEYDYIDRVSEGRGALSELGEVTGQGGIFLIFIAACPLFLRQFIIPNLQSQTRTRKWAQGLWQFLRRWHLAFSIGAVCIALLHGLILTASGEGTSVPGWLGYVTAFFMLSAVLTGVILILRKSRSVFTFKAHKLFALSIGFLAAVHIMI
jgi:hypothetical protein